MSYVGKAASGGKTTIFGESSGTVCLNGGGALVAARLPPCVAVALCVVLPGVVPVEAEVAPPLPVSVTFAAIVPGALPGATAVSEILLPRRLSLPPTIADAKYVIRRQH